MTGLIGNIFKWGVRNAPKICAALAGIGVIGSVALTVKATVKAQEDIQEAAKEEFENNPDLESINYGFKEKVRIGWKRFIPVGVVVICTLLLIFSGTHIGLKRNAALTQLLTMTRETFHDYRVKTIDELGKEKEKEIYDKTVKTRVVKEFPETVVQDGSINDSVALITGDGNDIFQDSMTGRVFASSRNAIDMAVNKFNHDILTGVGMQKYLNEYYELIKIPSVDLGWMFMFDIDNLLEVEYGTGGFTSLGRPLTIITPKYKPKNMYT